MAESHSPLTKRPTRQFGPDTRGNFIVSGGEWATQFEDGRSFAHTDKRLVTKLANIYAKGGEAAIQAYLEADAQ